MRREVGRLGAVAQPVAHADRELVERREHVELRQRERRDPVQPHGVAQRDQVEPAAAALTRPVAVPNSPPSSRTRSWSAPSISVGNGPSPTRVTYAFATPMIASIRFGPMPTPDRGRAGDRARRGDERIRAVVEVEQRALRALEQDEALAVAQRAVDEQRRVGDVRPQPLREALVARRELLELERLGAVDALEPDVLLGERDLDLLAQDLRLEQVLDADPEPRRLVRVGRADPALGRADLQLRRAAARSPWSMRDVPRHDQVRVARDAHAARSRSRAPRARRARRRRPRGSITQPAPRTHSLPRRIPDGHVAELVRLAVGDDRVAGVRAALVAADEVGVLREQVDDLALALVAPLRADDHGRGHGPECALRGGRPERRRRLGVHAGRRARITRMLVPARARRSQPRSCSSRARPCGACGRRASPARSSSSQAWSATAREALVAAAQVKRSLGSTRSPAGRSAGQVGELRVALQERELDRVGRAVAVLREITSARPCWSDSSL